MLFESTTLLLRKLVQSMEANEQIDWDGNLEYGRQCVYELAQMSRSSTRSYRVDTNPKFHTLVPGPERANRAIPHVKLMNAAIRKEDRAAAIECGKAAIAEMNGTTFARAAAVVAAGASEPANAAVESPAPVKAEKHGKRKPKPSVAAKRRPARSMTAVSL